MPGAALSAFLAASCRPCAAALSPAAVKTAAAKTAKGAGRFRAADDEQQGEQGGAPEKTVVHG
jgi:hypothetical protein